MSKAQKATAAPVRSRLDRNPNAFNAFEISCKRNVRMKNKGKRKIKNRRKIGWSTALIQQGCYMILIAPSSVSAFSVLRDSPGFIVATQVFVVEAGLGLLSDFGAGVLLSEPEDFLESLDEAAGGAASFLAASLYLSLR